MWNPPCPFHRFGGPRFATPHRYLPAALYEDLRLREATFWPLYLPNLDSGCPTVSVIASAYRSSQTHRSVGVNARVPSNARPFETLVSIGRRRYRIGHSTCLEFFTSSSNRKNRR